ncbi:MAG: DEAD/DEAH box helicase family protein [Candidatus Hydrogenedentes bacterium]|nr:DEAD/DEAH box helicase family protein [Candidatus Hydrogenedentota bacterium]
MSELRLKTYQQLTLDAMKDYFKACVRLDSAEKAFIEVLRDEDTPLAVPQYHTAAEELRDLPYVCLRLPTGAGKTLLASHTPGVAMRHLLHADRCVVLWLVTSDTIRKQTLDALKDREHAYRIALERGIGDVEVMDIDQAIGINRARLNGKNIVIVATIQSFRRDKAEWLRVHRDSSASMDVFERWESVQDDVKGRLERLEDGERPLFSLANALCLRRPIVIVDEAHNANTPLSYDTLAKVYPSCILEFTATPKSASNVLHSVSAAELDAEEMIKMPIRLETRPQWKELLADAIQTLYRLDQLAKRERAEGTGGYVRPVMLLQAQRKNEDVTVEVLHECLKTDHRIPEEQIAIATGTEDTLTDHNDIMAENCPIRFIITVDKLREGWDCPFAYVLATVREIQSSTAIEQILGRVMRLPYAQKKKFEGLNHAYAFSVSAHIGAALGNLRESLVQIGFEKMEARDMVIPSPDGGRTDDLFESEDVENSRAISIKTPERIPIETLGAEVQAVVAFDEASSSLTVTGRMTESVMNRLKDSCSTAAGKAAVMDAFVQSQRLKRRRAPVEDGAPFDVPMLCYRQGDFLEPFEDAHFMDRPWELSKCCAELSESEFPGHSSVKETGEVYQAGGQLRTRFVSLLQEQMERLSDERGWSVARLAQWLDHSIPHRDLPSAETGIFLTRAIDYLTTERGIGLADLVYQKYRLRNALEQRIDSYRQTARQEAYQTLLADTLALTVDASNPYAIFTYTRSPFSYGNCNPYTGHHDFSKHYYPRVFELRADGEEFECACFLDSLPEVEYWVRNIERRPDASFWLQTSTDKFYPDFVCRLQDGRILVIEYKGEDRWSNADSREKRNIGELWEERSGGACLFAMPKGKDFETIRQKLR